MVLRRSSNVPGLYLEQTEEGQRATYSLMIGERLQLDLGDPEQITGPLVNFLPHNIR